MMSRIILADITAYDPSLPGAVTLRYATQGFTMPAQHTNWLVQSENISSPSWAGNGCSSSPAAESWADGNFAPSPFHEVAKTLTMTSENRSQTGVVSTVNGTVATLTYAVMAGTTDIGSVGLYCTGGDAWGLSADSSCQILSGPGAIARYNGALFSVSGLSTTQRTLVRITRTFRNTGYCNVYIYPGTPASSTIGHSFKVTRFMLELSATWGQYLKTTTASATYPALAADAHAHYQGRIKQAADVQRATVAPQSTMGQTQIGFGLMVLSNVDGALDPLLNYSFAGRRCLVRMAEVLPNSASGVPVFTIVIDGVMEQAEFSWQEVRIKIRDRQQDVAKPHIQSKYGGTNALPNGLDGVAGDLAGRPKPRIYGQVLNVPLPCVNTTRQIYQAHDGSALLSVDGVYDRGAPLTAGAAYPDQATMESTSPAGSQYRVWNSAAGTFIRLGAAPGGEVTADLTQGAAASSRTVAQVCNAMLLDAGVSAANISSADITALDALVSYPVGFAFTHRDTTATLAAMDQVMSSVGAYCTPDALGVFRFGRIAAPGGASVATITATDVISIDRVTANDPGVGIPMWKTKLGYQKVWEVQNDLTAAVTLARKGLVEQEYRMTEASDATVKTANLTSPEVTFQTLLVNAADAAAEAARLLALYKVKRDMLTVRVRVDSTTAALFDLGKVVTLTLPRYGMGAGKQFLIIALRTDMRNFMFDLTLWG